MLLISRPLPVLLVGGLLALTGCGGSAGPDGGGEEERSEIPGGADPEEARVIEE